MKQVLIISTAMVLLVFAVHVYVQADTAGSVAGNGSLIAYEYPRAAAPDEDIAEPNVKPAEKESAGSNPGGVSGDRDEWKSGSDHVTESVGKGVKPDAPEPEGDRERTDIYGPEY